MVPLYQGKQRDLQEAHCFQKDEMIGYPCKEIYRRQMIRNLNKINCIQAKAMQEHTGLEICEDTFLSIFLLYGASVRSPGDPMGPWAPS